MQSIPRQDGMRYEGKIASWHDDKGYGFVKPADGGDDVFVHVSTLIDYERRLRLGDKVSYSITRDTRGRRRAARVTVINSQRTKSIAASSARRLAFPAVLLLFAIAALWAFGRPASIVPAWYSGFSLVAFVAYAIDKSAARRGKWRISESTLLFLGLTGGWPGGLLAQALLRHKTKKVSFRIAFWITVVINCLALAWLQTESGANALQSILASRAVPLP